MFLRGKNCFLNTVWMNVKLQKIREPICMIHYNVNYKHRKLQVGIFQISNNENVNPKASKTSNYYKFRYM